jgi:hypothetical protein
MLTFGVWGGPDVNIGEAFLIALIAILIVFLTLVIIILATGGIQKGYDAVLKKTTISPRPENKILENDKDAVVACLVATIDFYKETGKDARIVSITRTEE